MYVATMGLSAFKDERERRARLVQIRYWGARWGYRGFIRFEHVGIHGRDRGFIRVIIAPKVEP